ncbi:hypothetical protein ACOKFD_04995 [Flagellimonas sp. S174]|uniref:hypothetical protein n=1 Tax=Flagellimonas sp. S174 TaxID=3410790 RepID=UPI003BF4BADB
MEEFTSNEELIERVEHLKSLGLVEDDGKGEYKLTKLGKKYFEMTMNLPTFPFGGATEY